MQNCAKNLVPESRVAYADELPAALIPASMRSDLPSTPEEPHRYSRKFPNRFRSKPLTRSAVTTSKPRKSPLNIFVLVLVALLGIALACGENGESSITQFTDNSGRASATVTPSDTVTVEPARASEAPAGAGVSAGGNATAVFTAPPAATPTVVIVATPTEDIPTKAPDDIQTSVETGSDAEEAATELLGRAELYLDSHRYERVVQVANRVIEINPDLARAYTLRGSGYSGLRRYDEALDDLDAALRLDPSGQPQAHLARSLVHTELGNYERAIEDGKAALRALVQEFNEGEYIRETEARRRSTEATGAMAAAFFRSGNYPGYESQVHEVLSGIEGGHRSGVSVERRYDKIQTELQEINNALILEPDKPDLYRKRARLYAEIDWHQREIEDYSTTIGIYGSDHWRVADLRRNRVMPYLELGRHDDALRDLQAYERLSLQTGRGLGHPKQRGRAAYVLAFLYARADAYDEALRVLGDHMDDIIDRLVDQDGTWIDYAVLRGLLLAARGDFETAERYLDVYTCDAEVRLCDYPEDLSDPKYHDKISARVRHTRVLEGWSGTILIRMADRVDTVSVNRYMSRLFFHHWRFWDRLQQNLLASEVLIEQAPDIPDGYVANAAGHLWRAHREIRSARDAETARVMRSHYARAAASYDRFHQLANAEEIAASEGKLALAYRSLALDHLSESRGRSPEEDYTQEHFDLATEAYEKYAGLAEPDREFLAEYAFIQGGVFAGWGQKEDAQKAYKEAFDLGYDRSAVEEALAELSSR